MAKVTLPSLPFEKIAAIPRMHRIYIAVGTFLLLGGAFFYFIYMPKSVEIDKLKQSHNDLEIKVAKAKRDAKNLEKYRKQYQEAQVKFKLAVQLLPDKKEIPSLLEGVSNSGKNAGLEFLLFKPEKEVQREFYAEIPVKIEVTGGYHNLATFFATVAQLPRIVNISNLNIKGGSKEAPAELKASCVATTYQFVEPTGPAPAKGRAKKGRKG
jgi:type IV pilus assembly protein PilO